MIRVRHLVRGLMDRLLVHRDQWTKDDRYLMGLARAFLGQRPAMQMDKGGRCIVCHRPEFLHDRDHFCISREQAAPFDPLMEKWHAVIDPLRDGYAEARKIEMRLRARHLHGEATAEELAEAERQADAVWGTYQSAIRRMNRELGRYIDVPLAELMPSRRQMAEE